MYCRTSACRLVPCREATCLAFSTSLSSTERVRFMHTVYVRTCRVSRGNGVREDMCPACARDANAAEIPMKDRQVETCMGVAFAEKRRSPEILKNSGAIWSGTPGSNRRPSPWQGEQTESPMVYAPHQPSPTFKNRSGSVRPEEPEDHQRSPVVHSCFVPQVFQDGARRLDVGQVAVLLGWTSGAVRAACERGDLAYFRDHLNAYRIPCSAVAAAAKRKATEGDNSTNTTKELEDTPLPPRNGDPPSA